MDDATQWTATEWIGDRLDDAIGRLGASPKIRTEHPLRVAMFEELGLILSAGTDGLIGLVELKGPDSEPYAVYGGQLPAGLDFSMSRDQVRAELGEPQGHLEEARKVLAQQLLPWDRWDGFAGDIALQVVYSEDKTRLVRVFLKAPNSDTFF